MLEPVLTIKHALRRRNDTVERLWRVPLFGAGEMTRRLLAVLANRVRTADRVASV